MPPIEPSLRSSLLTGVSALALSTAAASAQGVQSSSTSAPDPKFAFWVEGALFSTAGGSFNLPALPFVGPPFFAFNHGNGNEGALGFDYRWPDAAWHFAFDVRYGRSRTQSTSGNFAASIPNSVGALFPGTSISQATEHESHFVTDFMVGRDMGLGGTGQLQFGIRVADLQADGQIVQAGFRTGFVSPVEVASGDWHSRFIGAGPRAAWVGTVPIIGWWTFDYGGGIAGLIGERSFDASVTASFPGGTLSSSQKSLTAIFNADASLALSYLLTNGIKISGGIRGDYYNAALTTYNVNTGALQSIDRLYWGPFIRLTGLF